MISHFTYRLKFLFTIILIGALCANLSEELKEKEVQESNEKIEYVYSHLGSFELKDTFSKNVVRKLFSDYQNFEEVYAFSIIKYRLFIKFCQLIHYN